MDFIRETLQCNASSPDPAALCARLRPGGWAIEADLHPPSSHDPAQLAFGDGMVGAMALSLSSVTAIGLSLGPALVDRLAELGLFPGPLAGLALHELIVNAVIHGNLQVESGCANQWQDIKERQALIAGALADPVRAARVVTITLGWRVARVVAAIADEGCGYDPAEPCAPGRGTGRGLRLARMVGCVAVRDRGRQTTITMDGAPPRRSECQ